MKKVLLVSNTVMHYRVSVYNYFHRRFREQGWDFIVRSDSLQKENPHPIRFDFQEVPFRFGLYAAEIDRIRPDAVILFLHLKDFIMWPLLHWLKFRNIPVINWTKGANLDEPDSALKYQLFNYIHGRSDGIILYSKEELKYIRSRYHHKVTYANNTLNFEDFPQIQESREQIRKELGIPFRKVVLSVGRMGVGGKRKKIQHLIEIFKHADMKDYGLVIVGSGVDAGEVNGNGNIRYLGEVYDPLHIQISRIFKMADLFSIPGHVGLGLNQAFYWGLPVVTEDGLQPPEIHYLVNGRNGFIVRNNDLGELKAKIVYLLKNDDVRERFSRNAGKDIRENGSVERMYQGFQKCVDMVSTTHLAR